MRAARRPVIAIVTDTLYPYFKGGKEIRCVEIVDRLRDRADVDIYTMSWWSPGAPPDVRGVTHHAIARRMSLYAGGRRSLAEAVCFGLATVRLTFRRFDVVEADHIPYTPLFVLRAITVVRRKRLVATWHEVWGRELWLTYLGRPGRVAWWVERTSMLLPDVIVAASAETASRLEPYVRRATQIVVAPNGLDLDQVREAPPGPDPTDLVFVGRLLEHKHVDLLVEAVALLAAKGTNVTARVVGTGPELPRLRQLANQRGVSHLVEFRDDVADQRTVYSMLKAARVFVFPSVREGFGISVLEALACGLSVVTTSAPDNLSQALVRETGRGVVCEASAPVIAESISALLGTDDAPSSMSPIEFDDFLRQYDWGRVTDVVASALKVTDE